MGRRRQADVDMENRQNTSIPEWVLTGLVIIFVCKQHNAGVGPRVDRVGLIESCLQCMSYGM